MKFEIIALPHFRRELKRLSKKYRSLKADLTVLFEALSTNPTLGTPLGKDIYKIRVGISSKGKGKSGGARIITYVQVDQTTVLLVSIYSKGDKDTISDDEIREILNQSNL
ncbi:MAG: type II toxin-antitoxin system RelE/ParE family toxin [Candidatus Cyclonatronum sp.]|uniref:type II toxin-antitoxin system RelE family toxin n=1 Tax=Cyclonatronum sp. TaxID=3024185 RepID=UPI0025C40CCC|nr:type II toxin-antitoxin system RelE/ParE family toxin [Cyclonatronum sp.]MCC5933283.1 type II toxin-antitoxin system RelE/ParE family toxin [Balneolales bacterium]MCH8485395.1 type II toxin-antitoxin system RelE/ParE family toxin [Cyclonatronum sp.]